METLVREITMENGQRVFFTAGPRYPFWKISFERGAVPKKLDGLYQDYAKALYDVEVYMASREKNPQKIQKTQKED